ncbi:MAG: chromosomal replication initiator protein DnaA [Myxococcota bacterium]|nr:chromosomal replication initiator protein DnaA [Myxococcota bacterium]MDW8362095.1 chromosomal replication initiator protein DnaA [Myxococcales bacterium]
MSELWQRALDELRERVSADMYEAWLRPLRCSALDEQGLAIEVPNRFYQDWLTSNYLQPILEAIERRAGWRPRRVTWIVNEALQAEMEAPAEPPASVPPRRSTPAPSRSVTSLNPKYCFETFVVGPSNQLAHAASLAAASDPGRRFNPLFIYGGVGLGKSHLVNAVGHRILRDLPHARVLYVSAERFTNEFIAALQNHRIAEFRQRYRVECDVLLMDDIQFLAGREQTQEEFFHTFNALHHHDRQIVVTCDVYPERIPEMQERLVSRFQSGMVADIQPPELDTRVAILHKKAELEGIVLPNDVALFVAQQVKSNVRELEGSLLRLAACADLAGRPLDLELAREALRTTHSVAERATTIDDVQRAVSEYFDVRLADLKSHRRHRSVTYPRMIAMYLCRERVGASLPAIGQSFNGKDHTTVLSAVRKIKGLLDANDPRTRAAVDAIERKLG